MATVIPEPDPKGVMYTLNGNQREISLAVALSSLFLLHHFFLNKSPFPFNKSFINLIICKHIDTI